MTNTLYSFGLGFADERFDESAFQDRIVQELGTDLTRVVIQSRDIAELLPRAVELSEKPTLRTALAPLLRLSKAVQDAGLKVVLTGEGADELFAGYDVFRENDVRHFWAREPESKLRPLLFARLNEFIAGDLKRSGAFVSSFYGRGLTETDDPLYSHRIRFANTARTLSMFDPGLVERARAADDPAARLIARLPDRFERFSPLGKAQYVEIQTFLEGYLLHSQGDRMLMGHSIEGRFPFLDYRVAEFAAALPDRLRLRGLEEKYALRRAVSTFLPEEVYARRKRPYRAPIGRVFVGEDAPDYVRELLSAESLSAAGIFRPEAVQRVVAKFEANADRASETDEMALVGAISTMLLHEQLVANPDPCPCRPPDARRRRRNRPVGTPSPGGRSLTQTVATLARPRHQRLLHDSLLVAAHDLGDKPAIVTKEARLSYAELLDQAARLAHALQEQGLERGDRVAIFMDNTASCCVSIFGTLLAGGVFMIVNPQTKADKLAFILDDSEASILLDRVEPRAQLGARDRGQPHAQERPLGRRRRRATSACATSRRRSTRPSRPRPTRARSRSTSRR